MPGSRIGRRARYFSVQDLQIQENSGCQSDLTGTLCLALNTENQGLNMLVCTNYEVVFEAKILPPPEIRGIKSIGCSRRRFDLFAPRIRI